MVSFALSDEQEAFGKTPESFSRRELLSGYRAGATTASEAAHRLRWTRREHRFDELDLFGRCLAVTETMAHLDVLAVAGRLRRTDTASVSCYTTA
jgi:hypothetical protein